MARTRKYNSKKNITRKNGNKKMRTWKLKGGDGGPRKRITRSDAQSHSRGGKPLNLFPPSKPKHSPPLPPQKSTEHPTDKLPNSKPQNSTAKYPYSVHDINTEKGYYKLLEKNPSITATHVQSSIAGTGLSPRNPRNKTMSSEEAIKFYSGSILEDLRNILQHGDSSPTTTTKSNTGVNLGHRRTTQRGVIPVDNNNNYVTNNGEKFGFGPINSSTHPTTPTNLHRRVSLPGSLKKFSETNTTEYYGFPKNANSSATISQAPHLPTTIPPPPPLPPTIPPPPPLPPTIPHPPPLPPTIPQPSSTTPPQPTTPALKSEGKFNINLASAKSRLRKTNNKTPPKSRPQISVQGTSLLKAFEEMEKRIPKLPNEQNDPTKNSNFPNNTEVNIKHNMLQSGHENSSKTTQNNIKVQPNTTSPPILNITKLKAPEYVSKRMFGMRKAFFNPNENSNGSNDDN